MWVFENRQPQTALARIQNEQTACQRGVFLGLPGCSRFRVERLGKIGIRMLVEE